MVILFLLIESRCVNIFLTNILKCKPQISMKSKMHVAIDHKGVGEGVTPHPPLAHCLIYVSGISSRWGNSEYAVFVGVGFFKLDFPKMFFLIIFHISLPFCQIFDGADTSSISTRLMRVSGTVGNGWQGHQFLSSGHEMTIVFTSDAYDTAQGFNASYSGKVV